MKSSTWKWIGIAALAVIGILALIVGIEWLVVPIHKLPTFLGQKKGRGHYKRRGEALVVVGVVILAVTAYLAYRFAKIDRARIVRRRCRCAVGRYRFRSVLDRLRGVGPVRAGSDVGPRTNLDVRSSARQPDQCRRFGNRSDGFPRFTPVPQLTNLSRENSLARLHV